jgi:hypothetical protein
VRSPITVSPRARGPNERDQGLVAPEQRVDHVEGERVIAVVAARGEHRGEVHHGDTEAFEVVEVLLGPGGKLAARGIRRTCEPVGEYLVHDGGPRPFRRSRVGGDLEVFGVESLDRVEAGCVEPAIGSVGELEQKAVAMAGILDLDLGLPPLPALDRGDVGCHREPRLVIGVRARANNVDRTEVGGDLHPHVVPQPGSGVGDVEGRTVVMRLMHDAHCDPSPTCGAERPADVGAEVTATPLRRDYDGFSVNHP